MPDIRDFVRRQLTQTPLSADDIRALGERVADVLLDAAGAGGAIQVSLRIFAGNVEVDVLQTNQGGAIGTTGAITASPLPDGASRRLERVPAATGARGPTTGPAPDVATRPDPTRPGSRSPSGSPSRYDATA